MPYQPLGATCNGQIPYQRGEDREHRERPIECLVFSPDHDTEVGTDQVSVLCLSVDWLDPDNGTRPHSEFTVRVPVTVLLEGSLDLFQERFRGNALLLPWLVAKPIPIAMFI